MREKQKKKAFTFRKLKARKYDLPYVDKKY